MNHQQKELRTRQTMAYSLNYIVVVRQLFGWLMALVAVVIIPVMGLVQFKRRKDNGQPTDLRLDYAPLTASPLTSGALPTDSPLTSGIHQAPPTARTLTSGTL